MIVITMNTDSNDCTVRSASRQASVHEVAKLLVLQLQVRFEEGCRDSFYMMIKAIAGLIRFPQVVTHSKPSKKSSKKHFKHTG